MAESDAVVVTEEGAEEKKEMQETQEGAAEDSGHPWKDSKTQDDGGNPWKGYNDSSYWNQGDDQWAQPEAKETLADLNAKSSNESLAEGGIRVNEPYSFLYGVLSGAVGPASGAWVEVNEITGKSGRRLPGAIFTVGEDAGSEEQCKRAQKYARLASACKNGWVAIDTVADDDGDLSIMKVPDDASVRDKFIMRTGMALKDLSVQKSVCIFAIDDGNAKPVVRTLKPPEPWLAVGEKVEALSQGDVRFPKWLPGVVTEIVSSSEVRVRCDRGGELLFDWSTKLRPSFDSSMQVEAYLDEPCAEGATEETEAKQEWTSVVFTSWADSGDAKVQRLDGTEVEVPKANLRKQGTKKEDEEPADAEDAPSQPIRFAIFGEPKGRYETVLSIMSTMEWYVDKAFFESNPPPLPPALDTSDAEQSDETWYSLSVEMESGVDAATKVLSKIQAACSWKVIVQPMDSGFTILGPAQHCRFAKGLLSIAAVAERNAITQEQMPEGLDAYAEKVSVPSDLIAFIMGKKRNRLDELEAAEDVIFFFVEHPVPTDADAAEAADPEAGDAEAADTKAANATAADAADAEAVDTKAADAAPEAAQGEGVDDTTKAEETAPAEDTQGWDSKAWNNNDWGGKEWNNQGWDNSKEWEKKEEDQRPPADLMVFSIDPRGRLRAKLPIIRAVEARVAGHILEADPEPCICEEDKPAIDIINLAEDTVGWLQGKQGSNKKRIAAASGCHIEYFTHYAYLAGSGAERKRGRQYMDWLLAQKPESRNGRPNELPLSASEVASRDDVKVMMLTPDERALIGKELMDVETETKCFMAWKKTPDLEYFGAGEKVTITKGGKKFVVEIEEAPTEEEMSFRCKLVPDGWIDEEEDSKVPLLIFSVKASDRAAGEQKIRDVLAEKEREKNEPWDEEPAANGWDTKAKDYGTSWGGANGGSGNDWDSKPKAKDWGGAWDKSGGHTADESAAASNGWDTSTTKASNQGTSWGGANGAASWGGGSGNDWDSNAKSKNWGGDGAKSWDTGGDHKADESAANGGWGNFNPTSRAANQSPNWGGASMSHGYGSAGAAATNAYGSAGANSGYGGGGGGANSGYGGGGGGANSGYGGGGGGASTGYGSASNQDAWANWSRSA